MARTIEYFFTLQSPWSYLGHREFIDLAARTGATVAFKPVRLGTIFGATGGLPLPKRHPARQRYRLLELQRWTARRDLPMRIHPRHWPFDPALADKSVIAALARGADGASLVARMFAGVFAREENLGDEAILADLLDEAGFDAPVLLQAAKDDSIEAVYAENTALALERGTVGAPTYCLDGEVFWGQDRLPLLADALESGRRPYSPDV